MDYRKVDVNRAAVYSSYLFIFSLPWEGMGPRLYDFFDIPYFLAGVMLLLWTLKIIFEKRLMITPFVLAVWFFALLNSVSITWTVAPSETLLRYIPYLGTAIAVIVVTDTYRSKRRITHGLQAFILGSFVLVGAILLEFITAPGQGTTYQPPGMTANRSGALIVVALGAAWYLYRFDNEHFLSSGLRYINLAYVLLAPIAAVLTSSRQTFLAMLFPLAFILYTITTQNGFVVTRKRALASAVAIIGIVFVVVPRDAINRITLTYDMFVVERDLGGDRLERYQLALELISESLLLGYGSGASNPVMTDAATGVLTERATVAVFNTYLNITLEIGIIGIFAFALCYFIVIKRIWQLDRLQATMWLSMITPWLFVGLVRDWGSFIFSWVILALAVNSFYVQNKRCISDRNHSKYSISG